MVEIVVWHTNLEIRDNKYLFMYHMTYGTFTYLVKELEHFVKSKVIMFVTSSLEPIKAIGFMLY